MTTHRLAEKYIREQLDIIKKHGGRPTLTADQRREVVASAQKTFEAMQERLPSPRRFVQKRTAHE